MTSCVKPLGSSLGSSYAVSCKDLGSCAVSASHFSLVFITAAVGSLVSVKAKQPSRSNVFRPRSAGDCCCGKFGECVALPIDGDSIVRLLVPL